MLKKRILIVAGEASGDLYGAELIRSLKKLQNNLEFFGLGGKKMEEAGCKIIYNVVELAVVGFIEVLKNLRTFKEIYARMLILLEELKPDLVILIDYPGFNLRFARLVKEKGLPIIYYISPQIWAWGRFRINLIKRYVDRLIVIFKFEEEFYRKEGLEVSFVGHPLLDIVKPTMRDIEAKKSFGLSETKKIIAIMPGSREKEIQRHLPIMTGAVNLISKRLPDIQVVMVKAPEISNDIFERWKKNLKIPSVIIEGKNYDVLNISDLVLVASGTATVETAIMQKPMVIVYKLSLFTYILLAPQINLPYIGMVNLIAKKRIVPEAVQNSCNVRNIAKFALEILENPKCELQIKEDLAWVKSSLGEMGASDRAARIISSLLQG